MRNFHQLVRSSFWLPSGVEWENDISYLLVGQKLPYAVTGQNNDFVFSGQGKFMNLWLRWDSDRVSNSVSKAAGHSKPRQVFLGQPNPHWPQPTATGVFELLNSALLRQNSCLLVIIVWLMVSGQLLCLHLILPIHANQNRSTVSEVRYVQLVAEQVRRGARCTTTKKY